MTLIGMGFLGEHEHRVDPQGRISIPARFREAFKAGFVLTKSPDKCIEIYTPSEWQSRAQEVMRGSINQIKNRRMRRINFSGAYQIEPDRQGRFQLPQTLIFPLPDMLLIILVTKFSHQNLHLYCKLHLLQSSNVG